MNAFSASYSDFKLVKTRGCVQIIFEVPVEQSTAVLKILGGMPTPAEEKWFGIAPLDPKLMRESEVMPLEPRVEAGQPGLRNVSAPNPIRETAPVAPAPGPRAHPKQAWNDMAPSKQAGVLCGDPLFWKFIRERGVDVHNAESAAGYVRAHCFIQSRGDLNRNAQAEGYWRVLVSQFRVWQRELEYVA